MRVLSWLARVDGLLDGKCAAFVACVPADSPSAVNAAVPAVTETPSRARNRGGNSTWQR